MNQSNPIPKTPYEWNQRKLEHELELRRQAIVRASQAIADIDPECGALTTRSTTLASNLRTAFVTALLREIGGLLRGSRTTLQTRPDDGWSTRPFGAA